MVNRLTSEQGTVLPVDPEIQTEQAQDARSAEQLLPSQLDMLPERQREIALLVARGMTYAEIVEEKNVSLEIVRDDVQVAFDCFGVSNRTQLAAVVRANQSIMLDAIDLGRLSQTDRIVFDYIGAGLTYKQIALELGVLAASVRTYAQRMRKKLDVPGIVGLKTVAQAIRQRNANAVEELKPHIAGALKVAELAHHQGAIDLGKAAVQAVNDPELLKVLHEVGYISDSFRDASVIGLPGFVAAVLLEKEATKDIILGHHTQYAARNTIEGQAILFEWNWERHNGTI